MIKPDTSGIDRHGMFYWQVDRPFDAGSTKRIFLDRYASYDETLARSALVRMLGLAGEGDIRSFIPAKSFSSVNMNVRAELTDGRRFVVRIHPGAVKNGYFWAEKAAADAARMAGAPTYETFGIDDTRETFPFDYMVTGCLPGDTLTNVITPQTEPELIRQTGVALARIHSVRVKGYGFFDNGIAKDNGELTGICATWKDHVFAALERNLDYLTDTGTLTPSERAKIESILTLHENIMDCPDPRLVHNDLADWNETSDGTDITGILDWDECHGGDPVADFSAWSVFYPYARMEYLTDGYREVTPLPDGFTEKLHYYRIRYIVSKGVSRKMKSLVDTGDTYKTMLAYAMRILGEEFAWYGI